MASNPEHFRSSEMETELRELEELELEVKCMAEKIVHYRRTLPDQLRNTLSSILSAQRPVLPFLGSGSEPGPSADVNSDAGIHVESDQGSLPAEEDQETAKKVHLLKQKIPTNISAMPVVLKRLNECISRIDKLDSCSGIVHPVFKRKRTS